jgi:outer membrane lipase/esterase
VADLQRAGARTIIVPNSFLYAVYAAPGGGMNPANASDYARAVSYNTLRWSNLTAAGVHYIPADLDTVFRYVVQHPTSFGFTADTVLSANAPSSVTAVLADNSHITQAQQQSYLFVDGHHLTTAGQTIEADYEYSLLIAPSEVSLLGESAVQAGWAHAATIQGQLDPCSRPGEICGRHVWTSMGTYSLAVENAPGFAALDGTPFGGTVGLDWQTDYGFILGAAFTSGSQSPQFSSGGHFSQTDEAVSLYAAYLDGPLWGNAVLTYDLMQDNIVRSVPLGRFVDQNSGYTTGQSLGLALRGGRNFSMGRFTTGPVAGWILQQARFEGFTETGDTGITALSFGSQTRNSAVSQLGWRICMNGSRLRPFAEANWNHECTGYNRMVTASLTTVAAPTYSMDAVPVASDWATTTLGAYYELSSRAMLRGAASAMYANPQMTTCGGEVSLNYSF